MPLRKIFTVLVMVCLLVGLWALAGALTEPPRSSLVSLRPKLPKIASAPFVILQQGDTSWVQVHTDTTHCPGDPLLGHGGEATGGPDGSQTWCFEQALWPEDYDPSLNGELVTASDSCGTKPPWDWNCWSHVDVRTLPSQTGINFWHLSGYLGASGGEIYNGNYCLWCGSDSLWLDGLPVECDTWAKGKKPGYGDQWNCVVQLDLAGWTTAGTCTLAFDPRYDTECKHDYFYVDYYDGTEWQQLALFNGSSNSGYAVCGNPSKPNPDHYGFGDTGQPNSAAWVTRSVGGQPAFYAEINGADLPDEPSFRWVFESDVAGSDADGLVDTDGGAYIDNVLIVVDGQTYFEDFEHNDLGTLISRGWSFPDPDGVAQLWHQEHDPDGPYEGGDGHVRTTCVLDSSVAYRGRPAQGYKAGAPWRNGWFYRLMSPRVPITNTGCLVQYDQYFCCPEFACDYVDTRVRFYDVVYDKWCPWLNIDGVISYGGCYFWNINKEEDVSGFYGSTADSVQFAWELIDPSRPGDFCGRHSRTDHIVDNVSIGFYDGSATLFQVRLIDLLHDTFHDSICGHNSFFDEYDPVNLSVHARERAPLPWNEQLVMTIKDTDLVTGAWLYGSLNQGMTWVSKTMTFVAPIPGLGGDCYGTLCPSDFGLPGLWAKATEVWYYVKATDMLGNTEYWPARANPLHPDHDGGRNDYMTFSIMPMVPPDYTGTKILLVDGYHDEAYDYTECMESYDNTMPLEDIYGRALIDAGYSYDKFDIYGAGNSVHIHPLEYGWYDAVVWFTGPCLYGNLVDQEAQQAIRDYLRAGGKVVLCGDRIAYTMADPEEGGIGEDSLGGEFTSGVLGCDYLAEMGSPFDLPYLYMEAVDTVEVFGSRIPLPLDSLLVYRQCPLLKDMSYVLTSSCPDTGYTAQPLIHLLNPEPLYDPCDAAIYVERPLEGGQCVFINFDLSALVTHQARTCGSLALSDPPEYDPGYYYGQVELMRAILQEVFGLAPPFGGGNGGTSDVEPQVHYGWALGRNAPNPCATGTEIRFQVARAGHVSVKIYNAEGQLVHTLENRHFQPGRYSVYWNGANSAGRRVSSGVYFYKMEAGEFSATRKMLVIR